MKEVRIFYQERCPFFKKAFKYIGELQQEFPKFADIKFETIEETREPELADSFDYYYVPTFYIDGIKVHEGGIYKTDVEKLLREIIK